MDIRRVKTIYTITIVQIETIQFIEDCLEQECSKENVTVEEIIFLFTCLEAKI